MTDVLSTDDSAMTATSSCAAEAGQSGPYAQGTQRWRLALGAGAVASLPAGWVLSHLVFLPYFLGLFFFALLGLLVGALVYRVAKPCRPMPGRRVRTGALAVAAICWSFSLFSEAVRFPADVADYVVGTIPKLPQGVALEVFRADRTDFVRQELRETAWPGGVLGYFRWTLTSGRIEVTVEGRQRPVVFHGTPARWWWVGQSLAGMALLVFGIGSQLADLKKPPEADGQPKASSDLQTEQSCYAQAGANLS